MRENLNTGDLKNRLSWDPNTELIRYLDLEDLSDRQMISWVPFRYSHGGQNYGPVTRRPFEKQTIKIPYLDLPAFWMVSKFECSFFVFPL